MSTIVRRRRASRMTLGPYKRHELLGGRIVYPVLGYDGYGDGSSTNVADFIGPEMRADWQANRVALIAQVCVGLVLLAAFGGQGWQEFTRPTPNLYGIWQVDGFSAEGYRRDPLLTDELRWRRMIFDRPFLMSTGV